MKSTLLIFLFLVFGPIQNPWKAPAEANNLKNPVANIAGAALKPKPTNLTSESFQTQSDGAIMRLPQLLLAILNGTLLCGIWSLEPGK